MLISLTHSNFSFNYLHACINRYDGCDEHLIVRSSGSLFYESRLLHLSLTHITFISPTSQISHISMCYECLCVCVYEIQGHRTRKRYHSLTYSTDAYDFDPPTHHEHTHRYYLLCREVERERERERQDAKEEKWE